jgi:hypothetical protein
LPAKLTATAKAALASTNFRFMSQLLVMGR